MSLKKCLSYTSRKNFNLFKNNCYHEMGRMYKALYDEDCDLGGYGRMCNDKRI